MSIGPTLLQRSYRPHGEIYDHQESNNLSARLIVLLPLREQRPFRRVQNEHCLTNCLYQSRQRSDEHQRPVGFRFAELRRDNREDVVGDDAAQGHDQQNFVQIQITRRIKPQLPHLSDFIKIKCCEEKKTKKKHANYLDHSDDYSH